VSKYFKAASCCFCLALACGGSDPAPSTKPKSKGPGDAAARPRTNEPDRGAPATDLPAIPPEVSTHASDWPLPNRDYDNTRASFDSRIDSSTIAGLHELWRFALAPATGQPFGSVTATPLIIGDTVYLQDMASNVFALDKQTGKPRWTKKFELPTIGPNGVAVGWGKAFASHGDVGLIALELTTGKELWRFDPKLSGSEGVDIQPIAYGGMVFMSTVPASLRGAYAGNSRGILHALAQDTGKVLWLFDTVDSADLWGDSERNSGGGAWYPPLIDVKRDRTYWGTGNPGPFPGTSDFPAGSSRPGANLYTDSLLALDRAGGELKWFHQERTHDLFDWDFQNAPMRIDIELQGAMRELVIGSGKTGTVVAFDPDTGERVWRAKVGRHENDELDALPTDQKVRVFPGALGGVLTATAYADGVIYAPVVDMATNYDGSTYGPELSNATGALVALDASDGSELWSHPLPAACLGAATVVNDLVLTSDANGHVYALARESGVEVFGYDAPGGINAPLAVAGDLLLIPVGISSDQAALVALSL
jgi:glucose dehydrogenase